MNSLSITYWAIFIEVIIIVMIVVFTYLIGSILYLQKKARARKEKEIYSYLDNLLSAPQLPQALSFKRPWKKMDIILQVIKHYDEKPPQAWPKLRDLLIRSVLLPLARKKAAKSFTIPQILAAQAFNLCMEEEDIPILSRLLRKKAPIVNLHASIAAVHSENEMLINQVIDSMGALRRFGQNIYLNLFDVSKPQLFAIVEKRLEQESNPYIKACCYKILQLYTKGSIKHEKNLISDIYSNNIELNLAALRFRAKIQPKEVIPDLIHFLDDPRWELRATACQLLGGLQEKQSISKLESCLKDSTWYVRINAGNALKNMGEEGIVVLQAQDPEVDRFAYETARSVLDQTRH